VLHYWGSNATAKTFTLGRVGYGQIGPTITVPVHASYGEIAATMDWTSPLAGVNELAISGDSCAYTAGSLMWFTLEDVAPPAAAPPVIQSMRTDPAAPVTGDAINAITTATADAGLATIEVALDGGASTTCSYGAGQYQAECSVPIGAPAAGWHAVEADATDWNGSTDSVTLTFLVSTPAVSPGGMSFNGATIDWTAGRPTCHFGSFESTFASTDGIGPCTWAWIVYGLLPSAQTSGPLQAMMQSMQSKRPLSWYATADNAFVSALTASADPTCPLTDSGNPYPIGAGWQHATTDLCVVQTHTSSFFSPDAMDSNIATLLAILGAALVLVLAMVLFVIPWLWITGHGGDD